MAARKGKKAKTVNRAVKPKLETLTVGNGAITEVLRELKAERDKTNRRLSELDSAVKALQSLSERPAP